MADSFEGSANVEVYPGTVNKPIFLRLKACTASTRNNGSMPYGSSVVSAVVTAHRAQDGVAVTTDLIASSTESGNTVVAYLSYSSNLTPGLYHVKANVTMALSGLSTTYTYPYMFNRVYVRSS